MWTDAKNLKLHEVKLNKVNILSFYSVCGRTRLTFHSLGREQCEVFSLEQESVFMSRVIPCGSNHRHKNEESGELFSQLMVRSIKS